jgi:hypothetical protein
MATANDRIHILQMIQDGKINATEGIRLLEHCGSEPCDVEMPSMGPRWLRVLVTDTSTGKPRVNVRLPINLVNAGIKLGARLSTEVDGVNMDHVRELVREGYVGSVMDVLNEDNDERVQIFLE